MTGDLVAFGLTLVAAGAVGRLFEAAGLPRLTGYLVFGLVCGPFAFGLIPASVASDLQRFNSLAIAVIALTAGLELNFQRLRPRWAAISTLTTVTIGLTSLVVGVALYAAWPWLPLAPGAEGAARVSMVLVTTAVIVGFSPTMTIAVVAETRARGSLTDLTLAVVVLGDLVLIVVFALAMEATRVALDMTPDTPALVLSMLWTLPGSLLVGLAAGLIVTAALRAAGRWMVFVLLGACVALTVGANRWGFDVLLAALMAGLVVEFSLPVLGDSVRGAMKAAAFPVFIVFFTAAGTALSMRAAYPLVGVAAALVAVRMASLKAGSVVGCRLLSSEAGASPLLWRGLVSQAGVTLGLTVLVATAFPGWGDRFQMLMLVVIAVHELIGPVLFRSALVTAGEVEASRAS